MIEQEVEMQRLEKTRGPNIAGRVPIALRYCFLTALLVGGVGLGGLFLAWPLLTSTIGPTAYLFASHPKTESARFRNALLGHGVAIGIGIAALTCFGLLHRASVSATKAPSIRQVIAAAVAVGLTMFALELLNSHHAPAAATTLLITTGLAKPGTPLIGLVVGLAIVIAFGPVCGRWPARNRFVGADREISPRL
jgi:hypothetical protein